MSVMRVIVTDTKDVFRPDKEQAHAVLFGGNKPSVFWATPLKDSNIIHDKCGGRVAFYDYVYDDYQLFVCSVCALRTMVGWDVANKYQPVETWWDLLRACASLNPQDVIDAAVKAITNAEKPK